MAIIRKTFQFRDGTNIPAVGLGTYLISSETAPGAVSTAISIGYRHIDTASGYGNEEAVGAGIRAALQANGLERGAIFVTTKLWPGNPEWGDDPKSYDQTIAECDSSLRRLGLDYADLYLIHAPCGGEERVNQWRALLELKATARARNVGVSNFNIDHLEEIRKAGLAMPDANQIELHPWSQKPELLAYMQTHAIAPIAYSSLVPLSTWRIEKGQDSAKTDKMKQNGSAFTKMAAKYGVTEAQFLLRWGVQNGYAVLPKSLKPERMQQNIDLEGFEIDADDMVAVKAMDQGEGVAWATGDPSLVA